MVCVHLPSLNGCELKQGMRISPLHLPHLTLCCVDTQYPSLGFDAIQRTCAELSFAEVIFFTHPDFVLPPHTIKNLTVVTSEVIRNIEDYSRFMLKGLLSYVKSSHVLTIQWDGFVIRPQAWRDQFLQYDYIGAPWPKKNGPWVGNGGFSLRSIKLLDALQDRAITPKHPEDACICDQYRSYLEGVHHVLFAPPDLADTFSFEFGKPHPQAFGFHGMSNFPKIMTSHELMSFVTLMPIGLVLNGYFRGFLLAAIALKNPALQSLIEKKISTAIKRLGAGLHQREETYQLTKTLIKAGLHNLAAKMLRLKINGEGWNKKNIQLTVRFFLGFLYLR